VSSSISRSASWSGGAVVLVEEKSCCWGLVGGVFWLSCGRFVGSAIVVV
jgi:hypothetical protein